MMLITIHFLSIEPILGEQRFIQNTAALPKWVIIGAETGNRSGKVIPKERMDRRYFILL